MTTLAVLRPWISINLAISADGKISSVDRRPSGWTSAEDHQRLLALRRGVDALMVGHGTLKADRMTLTVASSLPQPLRCIVSRDGQLDPEHPVFTTQGGPIHLLCTHTHPRNPPTNAVIHRESLREFLATLKGGLGIEKLHCEGGGELVRSLAEIDAIDEFHLTVAGHTVFGGFSAPCPTGLPGSPLGEALGFELSVCDPSPATGECFLTYTRRRWGQ